MVDLVLNFHMVIVTVGSFCSGRHGLDSITGTHVSITDLFLAARHSDPLEEFCTGQIRKKKKK